jgi:hypothetical protein
MDMISSLRASLREFCSLTELARRCRDLKCSQLTLQVEILHPPSQLAKRILRTVQSSVILLLVVLSDASTEKWDA